MIESIAHKGLRLLWDKNDSSKLPPEQVEKIKRILSAVNTAKTLEHYVWCLVINFIL
jgi:toxin HigB-1